MSLVKKDIQDIKCGIIGDGPEMSNLIQLAEELKIEENVDILGFLDSEEDVIAGMKSSKVFVLPSMREGFGISLLEANACGLPAVVVNAEKSAAVSLIKEGFNGILCDLSARSMALEIEKLLKNDLYKKMVDSSKENAKKYEWDEVANKIERAYEKLVS